MVASTCRLELDLVEVFDVRHSSHGTPAALLNSYRFCVRIGLRPALTRLSISDRVQITLNRPVSDEPVQARPRNRDAARA
jgi:hypothetical protein